MKLPRSDSVDFAALGIGRAVWSTICSEIWLWSAAGTSETAIAGAGSRRNGCQSKSGSVMHTFGVQHVSARGRCPKSDTTSRPHALPERISVEEIKLMGDQLCLKQVQPELPALASIYNIYTNDLTRHVEILDAKVWRCLLSKLLTNTCRAPSWCP